MTNRNLKKGAPMRVFYRSVQSWTPDGEAIYQQGPVKFFCASMCQWWGQLVGFGARGASSTSMEVSLYSERPQANGKAVLELVPVDFCPWCGEGIETVRTK